MPSRSLRSSRRKEREVCLKKKGFVVCRDENLNGERCAIEGTSSYLKDGGCHCNKM